METGTAIDPRFALVEAMSQSPQGWSSEDR
jgi:hypothetical protein